MTRSPEHGVSSARSFIVATLLLALGAATALLLIGPTHTVLAPWDIVIHLDESWRLFTGQIPHADFHNPVGAFTYYLTSVGMHLHKPSLHAIVIGNVIFLSIATGLATFSAYRRLPRLEGFLFTVFIILLASAMCQVGRPVDLAGYVEVYNRYGWVLASILFLQVFFPLRPAMPPWPIAEGVVTGLTLAILVYTKVTFGIVCGMAVIVGMMATGAWRNRTQVVALIGGGLAGIVAARMLMGVDLFAYAADVLDAGDAQWERRLSNMIQVVRDTRRYVAILGVAWILLIAVPVLRHALPLRTAVRITAMAAIIGACSLLISFGNTGEFGEAPLHVLVGLYLWNETRDARNLPLWSGANGRSDWPRIVAAATVAFGVAAPIMVRDAMSIHAGAASHRYRAELAPDFQRFDSEPMRDFIIPHDTEWVTEYWKSAQLPVRINDGLALIREKGDPDATILTLSFSNPFPYALGARAPRGTPIWFDHNLNFTESSYFDAESLFSDVDYVAIPIIVDTDSFGGGRKTSQVLHDIYRPYLVANYQEVGRSRHWVLLKRLSL